MPLTLKEFELLAYLIYHKNLVLTRSQLLAAVWEMDYTGDIRTDGLHRGGAAAVGDAYLVGHHHHPLPVFFQGLGVLHRGEPLPGQCFKYYNM